MPETTDLPDASWCRDMQAHLDDDEKAHEALEKIGRPVYLKLKQDEDGPSVILRLARQDGSLDLSLHPSKTVEEDGLIVSMTLDTWRRLTSGSLDLATGLMGRDVKAKGSMFELMRIADPAETVIQSMARAQERTGTGGA